MCIGFFFQELMNETSSQFFELTQRKGWIKSVDIVVPKNWSPKSCYQPGKEWIYKRIPTRDKTDIVIGNGKKNFYFLSFRASACRKVQTFLTKVQFLIHNSRVLMFNWHSCSGTPA